MAHTPVNHPARPIYRAIGGLTGLYLVVFGVLGLIASAGNELLAQDDTQVLGQGTNLGFSLLSVAARRSSCWPAPRSAATSTWRSTSGSAYVLMVVSLAGLAFIRTDANIFNFSIATVIVADGGRPGAADGRHVRQGRHGRGVGGLAEGSPGALTFAAWFFAGARLLRAVRLDPAQLGPAAGLRRIRRCGRDSRSG